MRAIQRNRKVLEQCLQYVLEQSPSPSIPSALMEVCSTSVNGLSASARCHPFPTRYCWELVRNKHTQLQWAKAHAACKQLSGTVGANVAHIIRRAMSTQPPRRGFENFYPKGKGRRPSDNPKPSKNDTRGTDGEPKTFEELWQSKPIQQTALLFTVIGLAAMILNVGRTDAQEVSFQWFKTNLLAKDLVEKLEVANKSLVKVYVKSNASRLLTDSDGLQPPPVLGGPRGVYKCYFHIGSVDSFERKLEEAEHMLGWSEDEFVPVMYVSEMSWQQELIRFAPTALLIMGYIYFTRRQMGSLGGGGPGGGRGIFNVGKAQVTVLDKNAKNKIMFKDVAGCDEAKVEVMEFVNFLKNPGKYKELGAKIPRGALLVGPPGTGKTLLAKATAGEANVPFLSISGSDFMEMFVGVGPARVRDLFAQAKAQSPSIIFIDEVDAIGRARGRGGFAGGNDERENTLNQLLVEMDGFATNPGVVVLAGTNRPDILDKALLRPGRFDRQISIDRPDINGREQIFRVHLARLKLDKSVEHFSERLSALTPGFAGADIANVCNEAALIAARADKSAVSMSDFEAAVDRVIGGLEKKNKVISKEERKTVAYHEAGHAVVGWFLQHTEPLLKVSIVPRGTAALGFAQYLPNENLLMTTEQMNDTICMALGGRAAEQVMLGKISTGAQNDLERVTRLAYSQVALYGMNKKIGLVSFPSDENRFDKPYSNETANMIDSEVRAMVDKAYERTLQLLEEKKDLVEAMAQALLEKEVLNLEHLEVLLGPRPFRSMELRNIDKFRDGFTQMGHSTGSIVDVEVSQEQDPPSSGDDGDEGPAEEVVVEEAAVQQEGGVRGRIVAS